MCIGLSLMKSQMTITVTKYIIKYNDYNKMIVYNTQRGPTMVRVINSRLPVYKAIYGDGLGDVIQGLFRRIAPKAIPIAKQLGMKAIDVVREKVLV